MEKVYFKATLYEDTYEVEIENCKESNPESYSRYIYSFIDKNNRCGIFAVRPSKEEAINALKDNIKQKIEDAKKSIETSKKIYDKLVKFNESSQKNLNKDFEKSEYEISKERIAKYASDCASSFDPDIVLDMVEGYVTGATEQRKIDIDKAINWITSYLFELGVPDDWCRDGEKLFRKAMEE